FYAKAQAARYRGDRIRRARMGYDAAGTGRRNRHLHGRSTSANAELAALVRLRDNHRELVRNNPYAAAALRVLTMNVIGTGMRPRVITKSTKELDNELQFRLTEWAASTGCDYDMAGNLYSLQTIATRAAFEGGDALIIPVFTKDPENPLKLRVLEGDYLDHTVNGKLENNTYAVQGVVFNNKHERIGYYLHKHHPGDSMGMALYSHESKFI